MRNEREMDDFSFMMEKISKPTSDSQIRDWLLKNGVREVPNIIRYGDLKYAKTLDEVLGKSKGIIILFDGETKDCGHWTFLQKINPSTVEFFDPYNFYIDQLRVRDGKFPYLSFLLLEDKKIKKYLFNPLRMQRFDKDISTCGRHVALRVLYRKIPILKFCSIIKDQEAFYSKRLIDLFVYLMTDDM